jgi:hypothetical protein
MSPCISRISGLALVAAIAPSPAGATTYQVTNLTDAIWNTIGAGSYPNHTQFAPTGINDNGAIIGTAWAGPLDRSVVALIAPGLGSTTTYSAGNSAGPVQLDGYKVNNNNDFVGDAYRFVSPVQTTPAESVVWASGGAVPPGHLLNVAPGVDNRAFGINDPTLLPPYQTVVGGVEAVQYISHPPFTVTPGVTGQIPELSNGDNYHVEDINDAGVIVGTKDANYFNGGEGFIDVNGAITIFQVSGAVRTFANGISNDGMVVGSWSDTQGYWHGYIYNSHNGVFTDVTMPGGLSVYLEGINDSGQIVGEYAFDNGLQADGFLLTPDLSIISSGLVFLSNPPLPTPVCTLNGVCVFNPPDLSLVDVLPLKEFRAVPGQTPEPTNLPDLGLVDVLPKEFYRSVPEPSTWAMMALGFAALGLAGLSRSRRGRASA